MVKKLTKKSTLILFRLMLLVLPTGLRAQQQDSLAALREFMQVCQAYKQLPLQLTVRMKSSANVITATSDTLQLDAAFYLEEHGSYIRMGEVEQVVNDSLLLLVSHQAHQMLLYANHHSLASQLQSYIGFELKDSSVAGLARKYTAATDLPEGNTGRFIITSRGLLSGTSLPRESIEVFYQTKSRQPEKITQLRRTLVPTDSSNYATLLNITGWKDKLVTLPGQGWFIVKELSTAFDFVTIGHKKDQPLPVHISDRVLASAPGVYTPVKQYEQFILNQSLEESMP